MSDSLVQALRAETEGLVRPGNIDLSKRVRVRNADGSTSTLRSMSFPYEGGVEVLVPTMSPKGEPFTQQQAIVHFLRTGQHLGYFASPELATKYAKDLSVKMGE